MKRMICLLALFLFVFSGCSQKKLTNEIVAAENETRDVMILMDDGERTKEAAEEICKMIEAQIVDYKKLEEKDMNQFLDQKELVLIGAQEENQDFFEDIDSILELDNMKEKRVSLFFVGEERDLSFWEEHVREHENIRMTPSFNMTGKDDKKEEEKNRMMGWLTTAFTY